MPLSTSSSESRVTAIRTRDLPGEIPWTRVAVVAAILAIITIGWREWSLRESGSGPALALQPGLWAWQRNLVRKAEPDSTVVVGSSRISFGFDQDEWVRCGGGPRPFMLAWPAICPRPQLHDFATDESFHGTLLVGVTPGFFFCSSDNSIPMRVQQFVALARHWGPADDIEQRCRFLLEPRFSILLNGETSLLTWLRYRLDLPQRAGQLPAFRDSRFFWIDEHCRGRLIEGFEKRPEEIQVVCNWLQTWLATQTLYPPGNLDLIVQEVVADVQKIRARGGRVIFVRFPSTGWYRDDERVQQPRVAYWDRLIRETGCLGIHFEDYPELSGFDCPENSHLTQPDAIKFTRRLYAIVASQSKRGKHD